MAGTGAAGKTAGALTGTGEMRMTTGETPGIKARHPAPHPGKREREARIGQRGKRAPEIRAMENRHGTMFGTTQPQILQMRSVPKVMQLQKIEVAKAKVQRAPLLFQRSVRKL